MERLDRTVASIDIAHGAQRFVQVDRERAGLPQTINRAVRSAKKAGATHVCWVSTGDTLHPERFSQRYLLPDDKGQCCLVRVESRGNVMPDLKTDWQRAIYTDNQFCGTGMVVPVHVWDAVGGFNEALTYCSDWDFAVRVQHQFGWECVPELLATANEYEDGLTKGADLAHRQRDRATVARMARGLRK